MSARSSAEQPTNGDTLHVANGSVPTSPNLDKPVPDIVEDAPASAPVQPSGPPKAVEDVLYSDIGITTLLNRLKQSIASARDFAAFLKARSHLEEKQAGGLKSLARTHLDAVRRADSKGGSYATQLAEVLRVHEKMGDNGMQFALSLHQMHEDLNELSNNMERGRKQWKHEGLDSEKKASDAEASMQKAKTRYDSLAESYDRARTGDTKGSRRLGLKGVKNAEQVESDLLQKVQAADTAYEESVRQAKSQREHLLRTGRPQALKALQELITECDSALTLQLQKYATFNEKLLLGNGLAVSPLTDKESPSAQRSLRDLVYDIDNENDFHKYVGGHSNKVPPRPSEIKYEQHPTLAPKQQQPRAPSLNATSQQPVTSPTTLGVNTATSQPGSTSSRYSTQPQQQQPPPPTYAQPPKSAGGLTSPQSASQDLPYRQPQQQQPYSAPPYPSSERSPTGGSGYPPKSGGSGYPPKSEGSGYPPTSAGAGSGYAPMSAGSGYPPNGGSGYPPTSGSGYPPQSGGSGYPPNSSGYPPQSASGSGYPPSQTTGSIPPSQSRAMTASPHQPNKPPTRPVFGVPLDVLFERDQSAVPLLVYQCIQAIDLFGLETEGIYRQSGTSSHIATLRSAFDNNAPNLDFRNPANFFHDVNSVATLLKQFFRELPDPLFTAAGYRGFIEAAKVEDEGARRDALHQNINDLPDPNYATLRALVLHLHRVVECEGRNRMGSGNLAICFAPSLMGAHSGPAIGDAGLQARVLDTILINATAIFDED